MKTNNKTSQQWRSLALRSLAFLLLWVPLTHAENSALWFGIAASLLAAYISVILIPPLSCSIAGLMRFIPYFLWNSMKGSIDVARRALAPRLPIAPELIVYRFKLAPGPARVFMANVVNLMPGTLITEIDGECLQLHVLDGTAATERELARLERLTAAVFPTQHKGRITR